MVDRQDIDALLIGALYGELTPADESRLAAHLESHPADRAALENLTQARQAVRESRVLAVQHEPPQAVSALLLQEAARRAPKPVKEATPSWFERLARSFMAHPAMAVAAMLVLVVGVAGTAYLTRGDQYVDNKASELRKEQAEQQVEHAAPGSSAAAPTGVVAAPTPAAAEKNSETYDVTLPDRDRAVGRADGLGEAKKSAPPAHKAEVAKKPDPAPAPARTTVTAPRARGLAVNTSPEPQPRELEQNKLDDDSRSRKEVAQRRAPAKDAPAPAPVVATAPPAVRPSQTPQPAAPPPPPASPAADKGKISNGQGAGGAGDVASNNANESQLAAARAMHAELRTLAKNGNCTTVGTKAAKLREQYPDYYNANVLNDRDLKGCAQYINNANNAADEKSTKSRAQKRPADMEAPAANR